MIIVESRDSQRGRGGDERRGANRRRGQVRADAVEGEIQLHQVRCAVESADSEPEEEPKPVRRRRPAPGYLKARRTPRRGAYEKGQFSTLRR